MKVTIVFSLLLVFVLVFVLNDITSARLSTEILDDHVMSIVFRHAKPIQKGIDTVTKCMKTICKEQIDIKNQRTCGAKCFYSSLFGQEYDVEMLRNDRTKTARGILKDYFRNLLKGCEMVRCSKYCQYGFKKNDNGCTTCQCAAKEDFRSEGHTLPSKRDTPELLKFNNAHDSALKLVKQFEIFSRCKQNDLIGLPIIGYNHIVKAGESFDGCISEEDAEKLLGKDLLTSEECIQKNVKVPISGNQFGALLSFVHSVKCNIFQSSSLLQKLNQKKFDDVCEEMKKWNKSGGKLSTTLDFRRDLECRLFSLNKNRN